MWPNRKWKWPWRGRNINHLEPSRSFSRATTQTPVDAVSLAILRHSRSGIFSLSPIWPPSEWWVMAMEGRRIRRFARGNSRSQTRSLLPIRTTLPNVSNTISCWYCDYKISALNEPLFRFGRRHARILRVWFSIGVGFGLTALFGVTTVISLSLSLKRIYATWLSHSVNIWNVFFFFFQILLWELGKALHLFRQNTQLANLSTALLFGFSPSTVSSSTQIWLKSHVDNRLNCHVLDNLLL